MKQLSDTEAKEYGMYTAHHEMDNGELRFRLVSDSGSSYIMTKSTGANGWQKSHFHEKKELDRLLLDAEIDTLLGKQNDSAKGNNNEN